MTFLCRARAVTPRLTLGMAAPYAYGSIAFTESMLVAWISAMPRSCRLFLADFLVRMWRLNAMERLTLPLPRTRNRFFAPLLVFILGMTAAFLFAAHSGALRRRGFSTGLGLVGWMGLLRQRLLRRQKHHHLPSFHTRKLLDRGERLQVVPNSLQQANAEFLMRHLAPAEPQRDLRLVALTQKTDEVAQLDLVIAFVSAGPEFDFLDLDLL